MKKYKIQVDCANCAAKMERGYQEGSRHRRRLSELYDPKDAGGVRRRSRSPGDHGRSAHRLPESRAGLRHLLLISFYRRFYL